MGFIVRDGKFREQTADTWIHYHGGDMQVRLWYPESSGHITAQVQDLATISEEWTGTPEEFFTEGIALLRASHVYPNEIEEIRRQAILKLMTDGFEFFVQQPKVPASAQSVSASTDRVVLCYSKEGQSSVRELYCWLKAEGFSPWMDCEDLVGGQDWEFEIRNAIQGARAVIVCMTERLAGKRGFIQREIKFALDEATQQPEGAIFIVPVRIEDCSVPDRLATLHWIDLFEVSGHERLRQALDRTHPVGTVSDQEA